MSKHPQMCHTRRLPTPDRLRPRRVTRPAGVGQVVSGRRGLGPAGADVASAGGAPVAASTGVRVMSMAVSSLAVRPWLGEQPEQQVLGAHLGPALGSGIGVGRDQHRTGSAQGLPRAARVSPQTARQQPSARSTSAREPER